MVGIGITAIAQLMGNIVEPNVMGETLNLSPLTVIVALILWGTVWGILGAFLCVPLTVIFVIVKQANRFKAPAPEPAAPATKDCPYCASAIPLKAIRCPHCTSDLK